MTHPKLLGISGALRRASTNRKLMHEAVRLFGDCDFTEADLHLPLYDGDLEQAEGIPASVQTLADQIAAADAIVISGPEYNKMISGVLKNALDWVSRVPGGVWKDKPVALMCAAGGRAGGETSYHTMRHAMAPFRTHLIAGPAILVAGSQNEFDEAGHLKSEVYTKAVTELMTQLRAAIKPA